MVLLAFSLQDQVEKYGAYVGLAAFFGLAVLSLLYFAQAREVKRLREWAGRAPERAAELEQAVAAHAEEVRRATPVPAAQPVPAPAKLPEPVVATANGAVKLKPEEVAALAFARAAGVHTPHVPTPHLVPAAAVAAAPPSQVAAVATPEPPAPVTASNGGAVPAPSTPAARRSEPPLPPRRTAPPARRTPPPPPRRESNTRAVVLTAIAGVLVLAAAAYGATRLFDGGEEPQGPNIVPEATEEARASATPAAAAPTKATARIGVYNGTTSTGLAAQFKDLLVEEGYPGGNLGVDTAPPDQQRQTSVVMFGARAKPAAQGVATALDIRDVQRIDEATQALVAKSQTRWDVVVIVGADKSQ